MRTFIIRRFFFSILTLLGATAIVFSLSRAAGDPLLLYAKPGGYGFTEEQQEALSKKLGLDKPLVIQYFMWVGNALQGDLGQTILDERSVTKVILEKLPATLQLGVTSFIFATILGIPLGVLSAVKRGTLWDYLGRGFALFGQGLPVFWIGMMGILVFAVYWSVLPFGTRPTYMTDISLLESMKYYILPTVTLGWLPAASYLRLTRSAMLEVLDSEYVKLARAKGVANWKIIWKHAFRNALIPPLTVSALVMASFLEGSVLVESVFAWPGLGLLAVQSVWNNDFPLMTGAVLLFGVLYVVMNFVADMTYAFIDPRIRYS